MSNKERNDGRAAKKFGAIPNLWGWTLRGIRHWLSTFAIPWTVHGVEITSYVPRIYRVDCVACLRVFKRIVRVGPFWFELGRFTREQAGDRSRTFDARGQREIRDPYGRLQAWRTRRYLERIDRENRRRDDERAMREGCS